MLDDLVPILFPHHRQAGSLSPSPSLQVDVLNMKRPAVWPSPLILADLWISTLGYQKKNKKIHFEKGVDFDILRWNFFLELFAS